MQETVVMHRRVPLPAAAGPPDEYGVVAAAASAAATAAAAGARQEGGGGGLAEERLVAELRNLGLLQNEARLLLSLMISGPSIASDISKVTGIQRTEVYQTLYTLQAKGIVFSTFEKPQKYYALAIADVFDALLQIKQNALRKLAKRKGHCQELFERMMESRASPKMYDRENYQVITGMDAIAAKMARMIPGARHEVLMLVSEKKLRALHHLDVIDRLRALPKGVRLGVKVMGCKDRDHLYSEVFIEGRAVARASEWAPDCDFITGGGESGSVPINMLIVDRREAIIIPEGQEDDDDDYNGIITNTITTINSSNDEGRRQVNRRQKDEYGFYVSTRSLASTFALVFEHLK